MKNNNNYINPYDLSQIQKKANQVSKSTSIDLFSFDPSKSSLIKTSKSNRNAPQVTPTDPKQRVFTVFEVVEYLAEQRSLCSKYVDDLKLKKEIIFAPTPQIFNDRCKNL